MNMNEALEVLYNRRSIRRYKSEQISREEMDAVIRAGVCAASGKNRQSAIIIAVTNREMRDRLSKLNAAVMGSDKDPFYGAPVVLIVLADKSVPTYVYDGSLVLGNMMNAAFDLGIGSCWIHRAKQVFESEPGKQILKDLGIEGNYEGIGHLILGYPNGDYKDPAPRKENYIYRIK